MSQTIRAIRGMNDCFAPDIHAWQQLEAILVRATKRYAFDEIRFPIVESTALFKRSVGEATDIVEKEMYTFEDKNGEFLTLRPEGTAVCVRACIEHGLIHNQIQKLWYMGPMFRHERPQKGRYRQFYQLGVEYFGAESWDTDVEVIALFQHILNQLGLDSFTTLEINTLGAPPERKAHRDALVTYFEHHHDKLDEDSKRRLYRNPLRILDSKNKEMKELLEDAPKIQDYMGQESLNRFEAVLKALSGLGIAYQVNPQLVRGLDYYSHTVFEWSTDRLGAQSAVCGGGRYDGLVEQLGGKKTPAVGFAMGLERLLELKQEVAPFSEGTLELFIVSDEALRQEALKLAQELRELKPSAAVETYCGEASIKAQLKRANKKLAQTALFLTTDAWAKGQVMFKDLATGEQKEASFKEWQQHWQKNRDAL